MSSERETVMGTRMIRIGLLLPAALLVLGLPAFAFKAKQSRGGLDRLAVSKAELLVPSDPVSLADAPALVAPAKRVALNTFLQDIGGSWVVNVDTVTMNPSLIEGSGIPWMPGRGNQLPLVFDGKKLVSKDHRLVPVAGVERLAREFMKRHPAVFGVDQKDLVLMLGASGAIADYLYFVDFQWTYHHIPVEHAHIVFRVNNGNLVQFGSEFVSSTIDQLNPLPFVDMPTAKAIVTGYAQVQPTDVWVRGPKLLVIPVNAGPAATPTSPTIGYRLVWVMAFRRPGVLGTWEARVNAHSGEILAFQDVNRYGQIKGGTYKTDANPTQSEVSMPFPYADYAGGTYADAAGVFPGSTGTSTLNGKYVKISDTCGNPSLSATGGVIDFGLSGGTDCTVANGNSTHAARTQYWNVTQIKIKGLTFLPGNTWLQGLLTDNVNLNQTCNAYWNGSTVNFFKSGGGCGNTGELPGVSLHEWGHGLDANDGNGAADGATGEAYGDSTGFLQTHQSCMGGGFLGSNCGGYGDPCTNCTGVRDVDYAKHNSNTPATPTGFVQGNCGWGSGICNKEVHCASAPGSQANWDLAVRDLTAWGLDQTSAWALLDKFWYLSRGTSTNGWQCNVNNSCNAGNWFNTYRLVDDCDGNLANGTPHASAIWAAFSRHEIGCSSDVNTDNNCACPTLGTTTLSGTAGNNQVVLNWTAVPSASSYDIFRNETSCTAGFTKIGTSTSLTFTDTLVVNGTTYYYRVRAAGSGSCPDGPMSNCLTLVPVPCTTPGAPTLNSATPNGNNQIDLVWTNGTPAGSTFNIYRSDGTACPGGPYVQIATGVTGTTYSDLTVSGSVTYAYKVTAVDSTGGCESAMSNCKSATATGSCTMPPTFAGLQSVTNAQASTCELDLAWNAATANCGGPISYTVYRKAGGAPVPPANLLVSGVTGTTYLDTVGLVSGTTYFYIVRAVDAANGQDDGNSIAKSGTPTGPGGGTQVLFSDGFEGTLWTFAGQGEWEQATPGGLGGAAHGMADPSAAHGGSKVLGNDLTTNGDYQNNINASTATSPVIDASGATGVQLSFWRWLNVEQPIYDQATIYVSNNGTNWTQVWQNPAEMTDNSWSLQTYDISAVADGQATVYIRFQIDSDTSWVYSGWNIDDLQVTGFVNATCTTGSSCTPPGQPVITQILDIDGCTQSGVQVSYTPGTGATGHDLYVDGSLAVSNYASGATYNPGDSLQHSYVVRALNGTPTCYTDSTPVNGTDTNNDPGLPVITAVNDLDACAQSGVTVSYTAAPNGPTSHDLVVDGVLKVSGFASGGTYDPGDTAQHSYVIRANKAGCTHDSAVVNGTDVNDQPGAPTITNVTDVDACAQSGVQVTFTGGTGAASHDLYVDTVLKVTGYTSGSTYNPGDTFQHSYVVRAVKNSCFADSAPANGTDVDNGPGMPVVTSVTDVDACAQSGVTITYTAAPNGPTSHDLWVDGVLKVTGFISGSTYNPGDTAQHSYVVRAIKGGCGVDSAPMSGTDVNHQPGAPTINSVTDADGCTQSGVQVNYTGGSGAVSHDLYVDGALKVSGYVSGATYNPGDTAQHSYLVRALNGACAADSAPANGTDGVDTTPPNFGGIATAAAGANPGEIDLGWAAASDNCSGVTYEVFRGLTSASVDWTTPIATGVTGLTYTDTGLIVGQNYCYGVRAKDAAGNLETNVVVLCTTPAACTGGNPTYCNDGVGPACVSDPALGTTICHFDYVLDGVENDSTTNPTNCSADTEFLGLQVADGVANKNTGSVETSLHGNGALDVDAGNKPKLKYKCRTTKANGLNVSWMHVTKNTDPTTISSFKMRIYWWAKKAFDPGAGTDWYVFAYQNGVDSLDTLIDLDGAGNYYLMVPVLVTGSSCQGLDDKGNNVPVNYQDLDLTAVMARLAAAGRTNVDLRISPRDGADPTTTGSDIMIEELELQMTTGTGGPSGPSTPTVILPNGGEVWSGTQNATWTASTGGTAPYTYDVYVSTDGGAGYTLDGTGTSPYALDTTAYPNSTNCLVRVVVHDSGVPACDNSDASDAVFAINNVVAPNPKEAGIPTGTPLNATKGVGTAVNVTYGPACGSEDHAIFWGTSPILGAALNWTNAACALGISGTASFDPGVPTAGTFQYFVIVGQSTTAGSEGSYGVDSAAAERPEAVGVGACDVTQNLSGTCP